MNNLNYTDLTIRPMREIEIHLALLWAGREGWNPGLSDAQCFYSADPQGFFVAESYGEPLGCISAVKYESSFGFLGLYIVPPEHRGHGVGLALWNFGMQYLAGRNVGLDGVVAQQENYKKSGFVLAHQNVRYELDDALRSRAIETLKQQLKDSSADEIGDVQDLQQLPFEVIASYDRECFRFDRPAFLQAWTTQPGVVAAGVMKSDRLLGYGVMRECTYGFKIGPLFADSPHAAKMILYKLLSQCPKPGSIYLDVPQVNNDAVRLVKDLDMQPMFETARMYTSGDPGLPLDRIYGITTFELG